MIFKKVINVHYMSFISSNNIQNNQRKDNLNDLNQIYKRSMFTTVGNIKN